MTDYTKANLPPRPWHWLRGEQQTLRSTDLAALAEELGIPFDQALAESGGLPVEARSRFGRRQTDKRTCPSCGRTFYVPPSRWKSQACSLRCAAKLRRALTPWNPLQKLVLDHIDAKRSDVAEFSRSISVSPTTVRQWFRKEGKTLESAVLVKIAAALELDAAETLRLAGGRTAEDYYREHARTLNTRRAE